MSHVNATLENGEIARPYPLQRIGRSPIFMRRLRGTGSLPCV
jgi:hypothetical protein